MSGIHGIGGVPDPKPERPSGVRDRDRAAAAPETEGSAQDDVVISSQAQAAAKLTKIIQESSVIPDVRAEKIAAAKEAIERGDFKRPDVVNAVARRINEIL